MVENKANILIVDDDLVNIEIVQTCLEDEAYQVDLSLSVQDALELLSSHSYAIDVVLFNRLMLGGSDFDVLAEMKKIPSLQYIPVIIQSVQAQKDEIQEGVNAGAFYYLAKPFSKGELLSVVRTATKDSQHYRKIQGLLDETYHSFTLLSSGSFQFKTVKDAVALAGLIARNYPHPQKVVTGIRELFLNAVEHGNLEITYDEKTALNGYFGLHEEVERRLALPEYKDREVSVNLVTTETEIILTICDEGKGFNCQDYLEVSPCRIMDNHGRGIAMANLMSFDSLTYEGCGNRVVAMVKL